MNWLQPNFYIAFPVAPADYQIALIDILAFQRLNANASFVEKLKQLFPTTAAGEEIYHLFEQTKKARKTQLAPEKFELKKLDSLHLISAPPAKTIQKEKVMEDLYLLTEKFFWMWPTVNLGSARHGLLLDYQIKGIGRNPLATRNDYFHSWGGQYLWQGIKAYVTGHILDRIAPLGVLNSNMVSIDQTELNSVLSASSVCQVFREADATRVTQVCTEFDPNMKITKERIKNEFLSRVGAKTFNDHLDQVIFHYAALYLQGMVHFSVTRENITLEGKLIDYEDVRILVDEDVLNVLVMTQKYAKKAAGHPYYRGEKLFTSSIHFYLDAIELTALGMKYLGARPVARRTLVNRFKSMIKKLGKEVFDIDEGLLTFTLELLQLESIYHKGETLQLLQGDLVGTLLKKYKKQSTQVMEEDLSVYIQPRYEVSFPRPKYKNLQIDQLCRAQSIDFDAITQRIMKKVQIEAMGKKLGHKEVMNISQEANESINKVKGYFPYAYQKGKIILKNDSTQITHLMEQVTLLGGKIEQFSEITTQDYSLITGGSITLPSGERHVITFKPILNKKSIGK